MKRKQTKSGPLSWKSLEELYDDDPVDVHQLRGDHVRGFDRRLYGPLLIEEAEAKRCEKEEPAKK